MSLRVDIEAIDLSTSGHEFHGPYILICIADQRPQDKSSPVGIVIIMQIEPIDDGIDDYDQYLEVVLIAAIVIIIKITITDNYSTNYYGLLLI